jgi:hypothetical protein
MPFSSYSNTSSPLGLYYQNNTGLFKKDDGRTGMFSVLIEAHKHGTSSCGNTIPLMYV